jgi:hypothetical protein
VRNENVRAHEADLNELTGDDVKDKKLPGSIKGVGKSPLPQSIDLCALKRKKHLK